MKGHREKESFSKDPIIHCKEDTEKVTITWSTSGKGKQMYS